MDPHDPRCPAGHEPDRPPASECDHCWQIAELQRLATPRTVPESANRASSVTPPLQDGSCQARTDGDFPVSPHTQHLPNTDQPAAQPSTTHRRKVGSSLNGERRPGGGTS